MSVQSGTDTVHGMQPDERPSEPDREELARSLIDSDYTAARMRYVSEVRALIINIEDWLAIDSWLGGGPGTRTPRRAESSIAIELA
jgi:hypothetical protein